MPLIGSVSDRIRELVHHGTRPRSMDQIEAIAIHSKERDEHSHPHQNSKLHQFVRNALDRAKKAKLPKTYTEPLKTPGLPAPGPITLDRQSLVDAIKNASDRVHPSPSDAQRRAGNYRMGHVTINGMDVTIESPAGSTRRGKDRKGTPWEVVMKHHYGYIKRTESEADGDHVDVFVGPHPDSEIVFVIDQNIGGRFDEHKCMLGFTNAEEAKKAYHDNYSEGWEGFNAIRALTVDQFKKWVKRGHTHIPIAKQVLVFNSEPVKLDRNTDQVMGRAGTGFEYATDLAGRDKFVHNTDPDNFTSGIPNVLPSNYGEVPSSISSVSQSSVSPVSPSSVSPPEPSESPFEGEYAPLVSGPHAEDASAVSIGSHRSEIQSHPHFGGLGQTQERYSFIHPDMLFAQYFGEPLDTFVAPSPKEVYHSSGRNTHYEILHRMREQYGRDTPKDRFNALENDWVLGRTGHVLGHRVTSFWNNTYQEDAVKAYVLQQIQEGRLHPDYDLIAFRGNDGLMRAGDFVGHSSTEAEKEQRQWTPEELARAHVDPALKAQILGSAARKFPKNPMRDALIRAGLLVPGQNWRYPLEAQRPGNPIQNQTTPNPTTPVRPLPDWVPQEDPDHPSPEKTGWAPVQSTWIAGLKLKPDRTIEMMVKKGGKTYPYPGFGLAEFRRWLAARSPGKWWWRNIGYPMRDAKPMHLSRFTGRVHPLFTPEADHPIRSHPFHDDETAYTHAEIMDWMKRHVHPGITDAHLSALVGALPGTYTTVFREKDRPIGYGHYLAGHEPTDLTFTTYNANDSSSYNAMRTIHSKNVSQTGKPEVHNDSLIIEPHVKGKWIPQVGRQTTPNPFRGVSAPILLRQIRAAHELGIPRINWYSAWTPPESRGAGDSFGDYSGGLHWPMIGADGMVPNFHQIPKIVVDDADRASNGRFSQTWLFSDFFQSPHAKTWYERNPASHGSFVDTTPGSYSRTAIERHVGENAARYGMEGPIPDQAMHQRPLAQNPAEDKMNMPEEELKPEPVHFAMEGFRHRYHEGIEHLLATGSTHPEYFDLYFNR